MSAIVWLGNDLRTHDHEPLYNAIKNHKSVIAVYNIPTLDTKSSFGFEKLALPRRKFLFETLVELEQSLDNLNIPLIVSKQSTKTLMQTLMKSHQFSTLYYYIEVGNEESVKYQVFSKYGPLKQYCYNGKTLIHPSDLPFKIEKLPNTFTQFRKIVEKDLVIRESFPPLKRLENNILKNEFNYKWPDFRLNNKQDSPFKGGEKEGLKRLNDYLEERYIDYYKKTRNDMLNFNSSTKFSPYLSHGSLSVRKVYESIKDYEHTYGKNESTYFVIFELLWRDFFTFVHMKYGNAIFKKGGLMQREYPWDHNTSYEKSWQMGQTGYPLIDASMRELMKTGFTSNRARQNVASFFTKNLGLDWRRGAQWYESWLIDHDVSSNYGNWNYIAGIGNDKREFRYFNVVTQGKRYDPDGLYAKYYLEELNNVDGSIVYDISSMPASFIDAIAPKYLKPIVNFESSIKSRKKILGYH